MTARGARMAGTALLASVLAAGSLAGTAPRAQGLPPAAAAGWSVVVLGAPDPGASAKQVLTLVSPGGQQYPIRVIDSTWQLVDVTPDGRKVLIHSDIGGVPQYAVVGAGGRMQTVVATGARFSGPAGDRLVEVGDSGLGTSSRKITLTGRTVFRLPGPYPRVVTPNPDATLLLEDTWTTDTVASNATGTTLRRVGRPAGGYASCGAAHWSSSTTFTQSCLRSDGRRAVYRFSTTGAAPVRLTAPALDRMGVVDSWTISGRQVVRATAGGDRFAVVRGARLSSYNPRTTGVAPLGVVGGSLFYSGSTLVRVSAITGATTTLAGGTRNPGQLVRDALVIGGGAI